MKLPVIGLIMLFAFPLLVNSQINFAAGKEISMKDDVPTVAFCELVKTPQSYLGKTIRITARISPFDEGLYFLTEDSQCGAVGVSFANNDAEQHAEIEKNIELIRTPEYRFRAKVTITGILRKPASSPFSRLKNYEFEIIGFEKVAPLIKEEIPTVAFCEMVKNPKTYFDKAIRLTATLTLATEAQYLSDKTCPLTHDEQIGASYNFSGENQTALYNEQLRKLRSTEYGSRAVVTVTGILRNFSRRDFAWYQYRFDIVNLEKVSHVVVPYEGSLEATQTYRAEVYYDKERGLLPANPLPVSEHHIYHFEWLNLKDFPELTKSATKETPKTIVFTVLSKQNEAMNILMRWHVTFKCKIHSVDPP